MSAIAREIPPRMRAGVLHGRNGMQVEEVDTPARADDEVPARVRANGICGTHAPIIDGTFAGRRPPDDPGLSFSTS